MFAWLKGLDDRVLGGVKMFSRVFVLGRIAAADMAADQADAQMHPAITRIQAIFAALRAWRHLLYLVKMRTFGCHKLFLSIC